MDYQEWLPLLGVAATDGRVISALAAHGVAKPVILPTQVFTTGVDLLKEGLSVGFTSEFTLCGGVADLPILSSVVMMTGRSKGWVPYAGPLPHGLDKADSKDEVLAKLGAPKTLNDFFCSGLWVVDGRELGILFTDDWSQIKQLGVSLPGAH